MNTDTCYNVDDFVNITLREGRHKRPYTIWFLHMKCAKRANPETESGSVVTRIWGRRLLNGYCWGPLMGQNLVVQSWRESERRKEANIPWVTQPAFALQGISQKQRKRERGRERKTQGPKLWWNKGILLKSVRVYIPVASLDKDQETRLYKFTKEATSNRGHKAKRQSISKDGGK